MQSIVYYDNWLKWIDKRRTILSHWYFINKSIPRRIWQLICVFLAVCVWDRSTTIYLPHPFTPGWEMLFFLHHHMHVIRCHPHRPPRWWKLGFSFIGRQPWLWNFGLGVPQIFTALGHSLQDQEASRMVTWLSRLSACSPVTQRSPRLRDRPLGAGFSLRRQRRLSPCSLVCTGVCSLVRLGGSPPLLLNAIHVRTAVVVVVNKSYPHLLLVFHLYCYDMNGSEWGESQRPALFHTRAHKTTLVNNYNAISSTGSTVHSSTAIICILWIFLCVRRLTVFLCSGGGVWLSVMLSVVSGCLSPSLWFVTLIFFHWPGVKVLSTQTEKVQVKSNISGPKTQ